VALKLPQFELKVRQFWASQTPELAHAAGGWTFHRIRARRRPGAGPCGAPYSKSICNCIAMIGVTPPRGPLGAHCLSLLDIPTRNTSIQLMTFIKCNLGFLELDSVNMLMCSLCMFGMFVAQLVLPTMLGRTRRWHHTNGQLVMPFCL